jgi:5-methylcytosine-specific restriction protein B
LLAEVERAFGSPLPRPTHEATTALALPIAGVENTKFEGLLDRMKRQRLHFSPDLVASYLLALQAKRFVILSGISGTGKTQLALTIAKAFQPGPLAAPMKPKLGSGDGHRLRVKPYMLEHHRLVVPAVLADRIDIGEGSGHIEVRFGDSGSESLRWSPQPSQTQILFKGAFRSWFAQLEVGDEIELRVEDEADAPVLRIDRVEQSPASAPIAGERTFELVAVRPDWTDNRGLLGYFNPNTRDYQSTAFLRLLLRAAEEADNARRSKRPAVPHFVILDEMNLARVEHYFSDFLSALESGEPLELHDNELVEEGGSGTGEAVPRRLVIPPNLYFTGTVNVDETTYMFSPKVLERAFVLEFNEVNLDGVGKHPGVDAGLRLDEFLGLAEDANGDDARIGFSELLDGELHRAMVTLNDRLEVDHRHFGYRVAKEIACFVTLAAAQAGDDPAKLWHAFDIAVLSKVLPKLHGTQQEIGELLERLLAFTINANSELGARCKENEWEYAKGRLVPKADVGSP